MTVSILTVRKTHCTGAALWFAQLAYPVFPCVPGDKLPLTEHGHWTRPPTLSRSSSGGPRTIRPTSYRYAGLLVSTSTGPRNGWMAGSPDNLLQLADAPLAQTPRGGRHRVFRQPAGRNWALPPKVVWPKTSILVPTEVTSSSHPPFQSAGEFIAGPKGLIRCPSRPTPRAAVVAAQELDRVGHRLADVGRRPRTWERVRTK